ncbi:Mucin-2 like [Melia azedarach]|uniref:Mucin-2 like n=1 Tax=Melia azedarach TaxID=155640 RepID=A0ACC1XNL1_MELAZ|nr:Mucin-2 like [Melia azedarach]
MESSSSPFFSHLQHHHHPCTASTFSASKKRTFFLNPSSANEPQSRAKKPHLKNTPFSTITPLSPPQEFKGPATPSLTYASASPTQRASSSCPNPEWQKKRRDCIREVTWLRDQLLSCTEHGANAQADINTGHPHIDSNCIGHNKSNYSTMENGLIENVTVENKGDAFIIHVKCPCGAGYEVLLFGGVSYYKLL